MQPDNLKESSKKWVWFRFLFEGEHKVRHPDE